MTPEETLFDNVRKRMDATLIINNPAKFGWLQKKSANWFANNRWVSLHQFTITHQADEPAKAAMKPAFAKMIKKATITSKTTIQLTGLEGSPFGFVVNINDGVSPPWYLRASSQEEKESWLENIVVSCLIAERVAWITKVRVLGVGGQGTVYEVYNSHFKRTCAMKEMEIKNEQEMINAISEATLLKKIMEEVNHPNILQIIKVVQFGNHFALIYPLCSGGELFDYITSRKVFSETHALKVLHDLISALHALHQCSILHLDIKPENILLESKDPDAKIKLTDFGLSKSVDLTVGTPSSEELKLKTQEFISIGTYNRKLCGTMGFMSPELILTGHISPATDVFAAGVVLYITLCGYRPFYSRSDRQTFLKTVTGNYKLTGPEWDKVSENAKELLKRMLEVDPNKRITTKEILELPIFVTADDTSSETSSSDSSGPMSEIIDLVQKLNIERLEKSLHFLQQAGDSQVSSIRTSGQEEEFEFLSEKTEIYLQSDVLEESNLHSKNPWTHQNAKYAIANAISRLGDSQGRLNMNKYIQIIKSNGLSGTDFLANDDAVVVLKANFVDSNKDGFVSAKDIFTAHSLIATRNLEYVKVLFREYLMGIPFPGRRQLLLDDPNISDVLKEKIISGQLQVSDEFSCEEDSKQFSVSRTDVITSNHVCYMFKRFGYPIEKGRRAYDMLIAKVREIRTEQEDGTEVDIDSDGNYVSEAHLSLDVICEKDFYDLLKVEDILGQVLFRRSRGYLVKLFANADENYESYKLSVKDGEELKSSEEFTTEAILEQFSMMAQKMNW